MKKLISNLNPSKSLLEKIVDGNINVKNKLNNKSVIIYLKNIKKLSPKNNIEFYKKIRNLLKASKYKLESINFDFDYTNEVIDTYENIREYILEFEKQFNEFSSFILEYKNDKLFLYSSTENCYFFLKNKKDNISEYLKKMSVSNKEIDVKIDKKKHSDLELKRKIIDIEKKNSSEIHGMNEKIIDEEVKKGYKKIDFSLPNDEKQINVYFEGIILKYEVKKLKNDYQIFTFLINDDSRAIEAIFFSKKSLKFDFKHNDAIRIYGNYEKDNYRRNNIFRIKNSVNFELNKLVNEMPEIQRISKNSILKINVNKTKYDDYSRSEFHVHTKMSTLDGVSTIQDYLEYAKKFNLKAITIVDHNSAQSYPEAYFSAKKEKIKINYGVEFDVYDDLYTKIVINERDQNLLDSEYVFFDLETTSTSSKYGEIIEFGAVKFKNNEVISKIQHFIKPKNSISKFTTSLTSITNDDVKNSPSINEIIYDIKEWIGDSILVAHNASFDYSFLNKAYLDNGLGGLKNPVIDSLKLSWIFHPNSRSHRLGMLAKHEFVNYDENSSHRADYDANVLCQIFERLLQKILRDKNIRNLLTLNEYSIKLKDFFFTKHITVVSKNQDGLKDINKLISTANVEKFNKKKKVPMLPLTLFFNEKNNYLKNLLIGSSCSNGFLFDAILNDNVEMIKKLLNIYDYLEIFPITSYSHLISNNSLTLDELKKVLKKIYLLGKENNIPVIITSNAHYAGKADKIFRNVIISAKRVGGKYHPLFNFKKPNLEKPNAHLRSNSEIFDELKDLFTEKEIYEMAIENTIKLQSIIKEQKPIKEKLFPPKIRYAEKELLNNIKIKTQELYGENVNIKIKERIEKELDSIITHGFSIIYYLSAIAVKKSMEDGYLVGSRGSVGSSIVATLAGITEVNPLDAHYRCEKCKYHQFDNSVSCGYDLPNKKCPNCNHLLIGDGSSIPFETFLGFNADKVPDIDLNFSRDNQSKIHLYMKEILGEENVFRAGTISTAAFKTAIGYVKNYEEIAKINFDEATTNWIASKIEGTKRTTGQHPGGLIVIPKNMSVFDFTPINFPGDDSNSEWKTTHFDFHSIHDNLLKLDLLGHLDPSTIRMLQNLTNIDPQKIPMNNKEVISLFKSNEILKYKNNYTNENLGIIGLPEFGTKFVRDLVRDARPKSFSDLVRVSGLSHGTDVWAGNAQKLIKSKITTLSKVISVRDDIMTFLISKGIDKSISFKIMESVRKGNGLTSEWEKIMIDNDIPEWYINSCKLIKYMFPKAHATAYVIMAYRIAWYKIYYPLEYYATFFSKRDIEIDIKIVLGGITEMQKHYEKLKLLKIHERQKKDTDLIDTYNIIFEMYSRGYEFSNISIHKSRSRYFEIDYENKKLIPPFFVIDSVGVLVAKNVTNARKIKNFESFIDFKKRCGLPKKAIDFLDEINVFKNEFKEQNSNKQLYCFD